MGLCVARKSWAVALAAALASYGPVPAAFAAQPEDAGSQAEGNSPVTVLEIEAVEAGDEAAARELSGAMRRALDERELGGGQQASLVELRLGLGCEANEPACLAGAGPTLKTDQLVYGTLTRADGQLTIELSLLDVNSAQVTVSTAQPVGESDLDSGTIDATAARLLALLIPSEDEVEEPVAPEPSPRIEPLPPPSPEPDPASSRRSDTLISQPVPKWKWAGLGVGLGLSVAGAIMAGVSGARLRGSARDDIFDAADRSLNDCIDPTDPSMSVLCENTGDVRNEANDVDPDMPGDLCEAGRSSTDALGNSLPTGAVRNQEVADACDTGDTLQNVHFAGLGVMGAGLVTSVVFTVLLFFPRPNNGKAAALRRRQPRISVSPTPGGAMMGGSIRF